MKTFSGFKAKDYEFYHQDGTMRNVIALYAGSKRVGFIEYDHARSFVDRIHDLCDQHEAQAKELDHETK